MEFINIENRKPDTQGMYIILIFNPDSGEERQAKADYRIEAGRFIPIEDSIRGSEYVKAWRPIDITKFEKFETPHRYFNKDGS